MRDIENDVTSARLETTLTGSSSFTMTLMDPEWRWTTSPFFTARSTLTLDGLTYTLAAANRRGPRLEAVFEPWLVAALRQVTTTKKARRGPKMSRARFMADMVTEIPGATVTAPEMNLRQPVAKPEQAGRTKPYEFRRGEPGSRESSWDAMQRLSEEVGWRCFEHAGVIWIASDDWLTAQPPIAVVTPAAGFLAGDLEFDWDTGMPAASMTVPCLAGRWAAPPGGLVAVTKCGAANGAWLVQTVTREIGSSVVRVELTRWRPRLPEPAPETDQPDSQGSPAAGGGGGNGGTGDAPPAIAALIRRVAQETGVDPALIAAICKQESNYNPRARSPVGAMGLMQLMPATARGLGVTDPWDPYQNLLGGAKYIKQQLATFGGDLRLALAAYNAGPGNVKRYGGVPPFDETQAYVRIVQANYNEFRAAAGPAGGQDVGGSAGAAAGKPLPPGFPVGGGPYGGTHTRGNWQSDNALDIMCPVGTPVYSVADGVTTSQIGAFASTEAVLAGLRVNVTHNDGGASYYAHLSKLLVVANQRVSRGQILGYSGRAGPAHLHFGVRPPDRPQRYYP